MHMRHTMRWTVLTGMAVGLVLAGCGPKTAISTCQLTGGSEVPAVSTNAVGTATATLDGSDLSITGTFSGLQSDLFEVSGSAAHIHQGATGVAGGIVFGLNIVTTDNRNGSFTGTKSLNADEQKAYKAGLFYVNVHTRTNTGGEIRGQFDRVQDK